MLQLKDFLQLVSIKYLLTFFSDLTKQAKGQVPLIFRGIVGQDLKEEMSPSFLHSVVSHHIWLYSEGLSNIWHPGVEHHFLWLDRCLM